MNLHDTSGHETNLVDREIVDTEGRKLGKVTDVIYDSQSLSRTPRWAIVNPGLLKAAHLVPVHNAYRDAGGRLVVPVDKATVDESPKAPKDHVVTPELDEALQVHYGLATR